MRGSLISFEALLGGTNAGEHSLITLQPLGFKHMPLSLDTAQSPTIARDFASPLDRHMAGGLWSPNHTGLSVGTTMLAVSLRDTK